MSATNGDSTWISPFSITAHAPVIAMNELVIDDSAGSGDNHFDPGEIVDFHIILANSGSGDATYITAVLSTDNPLITIPEDTATAALLPSAGQTTVVFGSIYADPIIGPGDFVDFTLDVTTQASYAITEEFTIEIGNVRYNPSGPDAYGYYAYDEYDGLDAPAYEWIEIAVPAGGSGIELDVSETPLAIPDTLPPNRLIAAFWDYMAFASGGQVFYYDDVENHRFIVEWYQIPHSGNIDSVETFEVILLDPAYYTSVTGDGEIVVNYMELSGLTDDCTVGIEDSAGAVGLEYLYNGVYDSLAIPLEDHFCIKFTTGSVPLGVEKSASVTLPNEYYLDQNYPNPFNPQTTISFGLPKASHVRLTVYNLQGRRVAVLVDGMQTAGVHRAVFDGGSLASGIYLIRMEAEGFNQTQKMVLVK
jgi:hypothetical protein